MTDIKHLTQLIRSEEKLKIEIRLLTKKLNQKQELLKQLRRERTRL